jgi:transcription elongation GreA/GreB family factor
MTLKQEIHQHYTMLVQDKIDVFRDMIYALTEDSKNDAKGSAGDKHETALSMMHIEQEKLNRKLQEFLDQKTILEKINCNQNSTKISVGSLVQANGMWLFVATALPKIVIDDKTIIAVSPQSPLGSHLLGKEIGFTFKINETQYLIEIVL